MWICILVLLDRSVQHFSVKFVVYGECVCLKNAMHYQYKKERLTDSDFNLVYMVQVLGQSMLCGNYTINTFSD